MISVTFKFSKKDKFYSHCLFTEKESLGGADSIGPLMKRPVCLCDCVRIQAKNIYVGTHAYKNPPKIKPRNEVTFAESRRLKKTELQRQEGMSNREEC